jgi:hypothetical protein
MAKKNFSAGNEYRHMISNYLLEFRLVLIYGIACKNISAMSTAGFCEDNIQINISCGISSFNIFLPPTAELPARNNKADEG